MSRWLQFFAVLFVAIILETVFVGVRGVPPRVSIWIFWLMLTGGVLAGSLSLNIRFWLELRKEQKFIDLLQQVFFSPFGTKKQEAANYILGNMARQVSEAAECQARFHRGGLDALQDTEIAGGRLERKDEDATSLHERTRVQLKRNFDQVQSNFYEWFENFRQIKNRFGGISLQERSWKHYAKIDQKQ
jgi:hypothetical protein